MSYCTWTPWIRTLIKVIHTWPCYISNNTKTPSRDELSCFNYPIPAWQINCLLYSETLYICDVMFCIAENAMGVTDDASIHWTLNYFQYTLAKKTALSVWTPIIVSVSILTFKMGYWWKDSVLYPVEAVWRY